MAPKKVNPLHQLKTLRVVGFDAPASAVLRAAQPLIEARGGRVLGAADATPLDDYTQIDETLSRNLLEGKKARLPAPPPAGVGFAGMDPHWRAAYVEWVRAPQNGAPGAFHHLYAATLECSLLECAAALHSQNVVDADLTLRAGLDAAHRLAPHWQGRARLLLDRAILLGHALGRESHGFATWLADRDLAPDLYDAGLGVQAQLQLPLDVEQLIRIADAWGVVAGRLPEALARMRLEELRQTLAADPLQWALEQAGETARTPEPWLAAHRDLRFALPQPKLRPLLEPVLAEAFAALRLFATETADDPPAPPEPETEAAAAPKSLPPRSPYEYVDVRKRYAPKPGQEYSVVLEFGASRSTYFDSVLRAARRMPGYVALLDETRQVVHRVTFKRSQLNSFYAMWDVVQNWNNSRVFLNGHELERWEVWNSIW